MSDYVAPAVEFKLTEGVYRAAQYYVLWIWLSNSSSISFNDAVIECV